MPHGAVARLKDELVASGDSTGDDRAIGWNLPMTQVSEARAGPLCRPYRPQRKGRIESGVKYVWRNFLCLSEQFDQFEPAPAAEGLRETSKLIV